jgi:hypothetical protein
MVLDKEAKQRWVARMVRAFNEGDVIELRRLERLLQKDDAIFEVWSELSSKQKTGIKYMIFHGERKPDDNAKEKA